MPIIQDVYRTNDGRAHFVFNFVPVDGCYEIDIKETPNYGARSTSLHDTHRLPSDRGGHKVCFDDESLVTSITKARTWVEAWAEGTWKYIQTGQSF